MCRPESLFHVLNTLETPLLSMSPDLRVEISVWGTAKTDAVGKAYRLRQSRPSSSCTYKPRPMVLWLFMIRTTLIAHCMTSTMVS